MRARLTRHLCGLFAAMALTLAPGLARAEDVLVFAAASLKTAFDQVASDWRDETGKTVTISYAGSAQLARQIEQGAPADLFISASPEWMDYLEKADLIKPGTRRNLLGNSLVLIAHGGDAAPVDLGPGFDLAQLLGEGRLAMALVDAVPAGIYGREALESIGQWDAVAGKVAQADNVRGALALVSSGEAPYGVVYATDAAVDPDVSIVATFPDDSHAPVIYPAALTAETSNSGASLFLDALSAPAAAAVFKSQGFKVLTGQGDG